MENVDNSDTDPGYIANLVYYNTKGGANLVNMKCAK